MRLVWLHQPQMNRTYNIVPVKESNLTGTILLATCMIQVHVKCLIVDTPFLTVLKTWTSPFEHSVIILVCVRLKFPEVSATRLASGSLDSTVLCLVLHQTLVFLLWRVGNGLLAILTLHRSWIEATSSVLFQFRRSSLYLYAVRIT